MPSGFIVMFAGNIGEAQDFDTLLEAALLVKKKDDAIHWVILGNGRKADYVTSKAMEYGLDKNFHLLGGFPTDEMPDFFACADALLVSLKPSEIFSMTIPSKVQSYLACGRPIVALLDGEGRSVVEESGSGFCSASGDVEGLVGSILKLKEMSPNQREILGINGRKYFENTFERKYLLDSLSSLLENHG